MKNAGDWRLCEIAFEAYELFCQSLSVSYSSGTDFIQIGEHYYWLYNPEENSDWEICFRYLRYVTYVGLFFMC